MTPTSVDKGVFGIPEDETGMIVQSLNFDFQSEVTAIKNKDGYTVGKTYFDESISIPIEGKVDETTAFASVIGAALTLINDIPSGGMSSVNASSGVVMLEGVSITLAMGEYNDLSATAVYHPNMAGVVQGA